MKKTRKKGFTLVELLVVIAILAVLASVSIVGYLGFVKKARVSNDVSLTTQMNTVLASNEAVDGKNDTPYDAITELKEDGGFDVNKISPTADGYFFGYDTTDNRMVLFDEGMSVIAPEGKGVAGHERDVFLLVGNEVELVKSEYSYYLKDGFVKSGDGIINVSTGVDVGENVISTIIYKSDAAQNVLIRTNGGKLEISDTNADSHQTHYGSVDKAIVTTGNSCFETHGVISYMELTKGKVIAGESGIIYLMKATSEDTCAVEEDGGVVIIPTTATTEDIKTKNENLPKGYEVSNNGTTQPADIANKIKENQGMYGSGTESDPFQIYNYETMQKISLFYDTGYNYFKVNEELTRKYNNNSFSIDCTTRIPIELYGSFDGSGVSLTNLDSNLFRNIGKIGLNQIISSWSTKDAFVGNFEATFNAIGALDSAFGMAKQILGNNTTTLQNIKIRGNIVGGSNTGTLFDYTTGNPYNEEQGVNQKIFVNDCEIDATVVVTSGYGGIVAGYPEYCNANLYLLISNPDTVFKGKFYTTEGKTQLTSMNTGPKNGSTENKQINCNTLSTATISKGDNGYNVSKSDNASKCVSYFAAQLSETDDNNNKTAVQGITLTLDKIGEFTFSDGSLKICDIFTGVNLELKQDSTSAKIEDSSLKISLSTVNNFTFGSIKICLIELDASGNVVSCATKVIASKEYNAISWTINN